MRTLFFCTVLFAATAAFGCTSSTVENCSTDSVSSVDEGPTMEPGGTCIACHASQGEGPHFTIAGTVMGATNDDTTCNGVSGVTVEITDADGQIVTLTSNSAGNFYLEHGSVTFPYTAKVVLGGQERAMSTPQANGECNSCHTADGANGAPGRILSPG